MYKAPVEDDVIEITLRRSAMHAGKPAQAAQACLRCLVPLPRFTGEDENRRRSGNGSQDERSEIRGQVMLSSRHEVPHSASLHAGYAC